MADFIIFFDVETTGKFANKDAIIQLSAIRFSGYKEISRFDTYVNPLQEIPANITEFSGITNDMVVNAPKIDDIRSQFLDFIQDAILIGYNTAFDLRFINAAYCNALAGMEYFDVFPLAKRMLDLPNYHLESVANYLGFHPNGHYHNSLIDSEATADVFWKLSAQSILNNFRTVTSYESKPRKRFNSFSPKDITPSGSSIDANHPIFGKKIVFTGNLSISRHEAAQMAVNRGALVRTSVSGKTDYLVVGKQDAAIVGENGTSDKEAKAHELNAIGKSSIKIINEKEFMSLLEGVAFSG